MNDLLDMHTHTIASGHAYNTIKEMAAAAAQKGLRLLGITDHGPAMPGACHEMYFHNFKVIDRHAYGVELLMGAELNIIDFNGSVDLPPRVLQRLDYAVASLHDLCVQPGSIEQNTAAIIGAMQNPHVSIIGHPDDSHFPLDYEAVAAAAKENHVLLELNSSSLRPGGHRTNARENILELLRCCRQYETRIIIDSDAHLDLEVGNHAFAHALLQETQFPEALVVNTSVKMFKSYIKK